MSIRSKITLVTLSAIIAVYAIVGGLLSNPNNPLRVFADPGPYPQLRIFEEVVQRIVNDYVEKPDLEKVRIGALRGLADGLDPYSAYLLPPQVKEYETHRGNGDMTGLVLGQYQGFAYVITLVPGSPADKAGIQAGDVIEYIDGHATRDLDLYDMRSLLLGAAGSTTELSIFRNSRSEKIKVTRGAITIPQPETRLLEQQTGYIKVPILSKGKAEAVAAAVREAVKRGAQRIVLDLRGSAGGELKEGVAVANLFLKSGVIAKTIGRKEKLLATYEATPERAITDLPVAVIVDRTTAGASEVVAAALMDNQRGEVVGERTFGMGSEQELFPLDDGSALLLTTARHASGAGKIFMIEGVTPSVEVRRLDLAEVATPDDTENENAQPKPNAPTATPAPSVAPRPAPAPAAKPAEDVMLKKAIEVLTSGVKVKRRAA
jgi:carboxyl-terminal processing protease